MNNDDRRIIINRVYGYRQTESPENGSEPASSASRWATYVMLIPIIAIFAVLGVFFFAAFLALFAMAATVFALRFWWLRRQFQKSMHTQKDESVVIEDAEIIEETKTESRHDQQEGASKNSKL